MCLPVSSTFPCCSWGRPQRERWSQLAWSPSHCHWPPRTEGESLSTDCDKEKKNVSFNGEYYRDGARSIKQISSYLPWWRYINRSWRSNGGCRGCGCCGVRRLAPSRGTTAPWRLLFWLRPLDIIGGLVWDGGLELCKVDHHWTEGDYRASIYEMKIKCN